LDPSDQAAVLISLAEAYSKLLKPHEALKILAQAQQATSAAPSDSKSSLLVRIATMYAKLYRWKEALTVAQLIDNKIVAIEALSRILIIGKDSKNGTKNMDALEEPFYRID